MLSARDLRVGMWATWREINVEFSAQLVTIWGVSDGTLYLGGFIPPSDRADLLIDQGLDIVRHPGYWLGSFSRLNSFRVLNYAECGRAREALRVARQGGIPYPVDPIPPEPGSIAPHWPPEMPWGFDSRRHPFRQLTGCGYINRFTGSIVLESGIPPGALWR